MTAKGARGVSAYQRLADDLRADLRDGKYPPDVKLPTEAELAETYRISRQTVRRAFQDLVAEGLVHRVPGRGTFAAPRDGRYLRQFGSVDDLMGLSIDTTMQIVTGLQRRVDVDAAGRLRLDSDALQTFSFRRLHDGAPFCHTVIWLPPDVGELLRDAPELASPGVESRATVIGLLDTRLESPITDAEQSITVGEAGAATAEALGCEAGRPVLRIDRLYSTAAGRRVELAISWFLPEQYSYRVHLRRSPGGGGL
ncbi:GntR family transcriptional regulator [Phaeacidiphilus oryzae]|uniref:GntR family transcriptional regulator n=1 Tax=Phaeacidiphilus oryzae TaxID=348818 RepID=UPI000566A063|nr:GntR family transcriptional regulator [Phaeacidiphilus oryzae]